MSSPTYHRKESPMLRGLTTVTYLADDVAAATDWYTQLLGVEPYFARSAGGATAGGCRVPHRRLRGRTRHPQPAVRGAGPAPRGRRGDRLLACGRRARQLRAATGPRCDRLRTAGRARAR